MTKAHEIKVGDIVKISEDWSDWYPSNSRARVQAVKMHGILVSNMNMPYQGTLAYAFVPDGYYEKVE